MANSKPNFEQSGCQEFLQSQCQNRGRGQHNTFLSSIWWIKFFVQVPMSQIQSYIDTMNTNAEAIFALANYGQKDAQGNVLFAPTWQYSYDFTVLGPVFDITKGTHNNGGNPTIPDSCLTSFPYPPATPITNTAGAMANLDAVTKEIQLMWYYFIQWPLGSSGTVTNVDANVYPSVTTHFQIASIAPAVGKNGTPSVGSRFEVPTIAFKGVGLVPNPFQNDVLAIFTQQNTLTVP